jgi:hypothetical protein
VPRKTKAIPENRAEWTFGEAVFWHLFVFGTRPQIDPATSQRGRIWGPKDAADALGISVRTLWNWVDDDHLPYDTTALERVLFGQSTFFDAWRIEAQRLLRETRLQKTKPAAPSPPKAGTSLVPTLTGQAVVVFESPEFEDEPVQILEKIGKDHAKATLTGGFFQSYSRSEETADAPPGPAIAAGGSRRSGPSARQKGVALVASAVLILGGFGVSRILKTATPPTVVVKDDPTVLPTPTPTPTPSQMTEDEKRAAEEKRIQENGIAARQLAYDQVLRQRADAAAQLDRDAAAAAKAQRDREAMGRSLAGLGFDLREHNSVVGQSIGYVVTETLNDCAVACLKDNCDAFAYQAYEQRSPQSKGTACYRFKAPLTLSAHPNYATGVRAGLAVSLRTEEKPAPTELDPAPIVPAAQIAQASPPVTQAPAVTPDGVMQCSTGPVKVTGFTLSCDRTLSGGTTLGSAQLSFTVGNINECAAKCRPLSRCVGFTFNAADPPGRHACMLFGPTPEGRQSAGWVSGSR